MNLIDKVEEQHKVQDIVPFNVGDNVKVHVRIREGDKERIQVFEGQVLAKKHGKGITSTITVRKVISGVGVERIFPLNSPTIEKIEVVKRGKVRRAKLYYLRRAKGRKARLKRKESKEVITGEKPTEETIEEK